MEEFKFWGENIQLEENFAIKVYSDKLPLDNYPVRISRCVICLFLLGTADVEIDSIEYHMQSGMIISVFPGQILEKKFESNDLQVIYYTCSEEILDEVLFRFPPSFVLFLKEFPTYHLPVDVFNDDVDFIKKLYKVSLEDTNICRSEIVLSMMRSFFLNIYNNIHQKLLINPIKNKRHKDVMKNFICLLRVNYSVNRGVSFYAEKLNVSPKYLSLISNEVYGKSAKKIIDDYTIAEIKLLLKSTNVSIQQIAEDLNFPDQSFLSKYFKKHMGVSPIYYR